MRATTSREKHETWVLQSKLSKTVKHKWINTKK